MKTLSYIGFLLGLAAITGLVAWQGVGPIAAALGELGVGVLLLPLVYLAYLIILVVSWRMLFVAGREPGFLATLNAAWIGGAVTTVVPVTTLGGEVIKARVLTHSGVSGADASASVVVDTTVQAISLVAMGFIGVALLVSLKADDALIIGVAAGSALLGAGVAVFVVLQRAGALGSLAKSAAARFTSPLMNAAVTNTVEVDAVIRAIYRRRGRIELSSLIRLGSRIALVGEIWLAAYFMGHPLTLWEALMLKSLVGSLRGVAFFVPNGFGVQEGAYVVLGAVIGLPPDFALAVSLASRARELIVSVPGMLAWQHIEGRAFWRKRAAADDAG